MHDPPRQPFRAGFSASGWLMMYQFGVAHALQQASLHHNAQFVGSSGGSLVAGVLALNVDVEKIRDFLLRCSVHCRRHPIKNAFRLREYVLACIDHVGFDDSTYQHEALRDGRLKVSLTLLPECTNVLVDKFQTTDQVIESLLGSCCMSPLAGFPFPLSRDDHLDGKWIFDGGLTFMHPHLGDETVVVSAFYWTNADIKPSQYIPAWWALLPPSLEELEKLFWLGVMDGNNWLAKNQHRYSAEHPCTSPVQSTEGAKTGQPPTDPTTHTEQTTGSNATKETTQPIHRKKSQVVSNARCDQLMRQVLRVKMDIGEQRLKSRMDSKLDHEFHFEQTSTLLSKVASTILDVAFLFCCLVFITPTAYFLLYVELILKACLSVVVMAEAYRRDKQASRGGVLSLRSWLPSDFIGTVHTAWDDFKSCVHALMHPRLLLSTLPFVGQFFNHTEVMAKVERQSLLYRVLKHASIFNDKAKTATTTP